MAKTKKRTASGRVRMEWEEQKHEVATRHRRQREISTEEANPTGHEETEMPLTRKDIPELVREVVHSMAPFQSSGNSTQPSVGGDSSGASTSASRETPTDESSAPLTRNDIPKLVQQVEHALASGPSNKSGLQPDKSVYIAQIVKMLCLQMCAVWQAMFGLL